MRRRSFLKTLLSAAIVAVATSIPGLASFEDPTLVLGRKRIADAAASYIKQRLSEESFARKILRPVFVTPREVPHVCVSQDNGYCVCAAVLVHA